MSSPRPSGWLGVVSLVCLLFSTTVVFGQGDKKEDPAHDELRALLGKMTKAYNEQDLDKLASFLDENVTVTWQNGEINRTPEEVKENIKKLTKGPDRVVEKVTIKPEAEKLTVLYLDSKMAVAAGHSDDTFILTDGRKLDFKTRWTASLMKKDGKWKVTSVHLSFNGFDNAVIDMAIQQTAWWTGISAGVGGLVLGVVLVIVIGKMFGGGGNPKQPATNPPAAETS